MKEKILISTSSFGEDSREPLALLEDAGFELVLNPYKRTLTSTELLSLGRGCVGVVAGTEKYDEAVMRNWKGLRVISRCGTGMDAVDLNAAAALNIVVESTPYGPTQAVVELTLGMILSLIRHVPAATAQMRSGTWKKRMGFSLSEIRVGILGLGKIGKRLAGILRKLGAEVVGHDRAPDPVWAKEAGVTLLSTDEVIRSANVLCLHVPYEKESHHMINRKTIEMMPLGAFIVNTSRGGLIDEEALAEALKSSRLSGAALDVFEKEPYTGPLQNLDNIILTPHVGAYARAGRIEMEKDASKNLLKALRAQPVQG